MQNPSGIPTLLALSFVPSIPQTYYNSKSLPYIQTYAVFPFRLTHQMAAMHYRILPLAIALAAVFMFFPYRAVAKGNAAWDRLNKKSTELFKQGEFSEAEAVLKQALALAERVDGQEHANVATSLNNLATLYISQERFEEAEPLIHRAIAIREKLFGPDHVATAISIANLAGFYRGGGLFSVAELLYRHVLLIFIREFGPDHESVATSSNNLGAIYLEQGKLGDAASMFRTALRIQEKIYGSDHPLTMGTMENLGKVGELNDQGDQN